MRSITRCIRLERLPHQMDVVKSTMSAFRIFSVMAGQSSSRLSLSQAHGQLLVGQADDFALHLDPVLLHVVEDELGELFGVGDLWLVLQRGVEHQDFD